MTTIQTCDICVNSLFPDIAGIRESISWTMPLPLNRLELPVPELPSLPAPPGLPKPFPPPVSGFVRSFNEEKARFASELQNYQHLAVIQTITDAIVEKAQSLGLPIPPLPKLLPLDADIIDVLQPQPAVLIASLIPFLPDFPVAPFPPPLPWNAEFPSITCGSPPFDCVPGFEFPINPSNRNLQEEAQQTFQQMTRNLIATMIDYIAGLIDDIISFLALGIMGLRDWIAEIAGLWPFPLPTWQDLLDLIASAIRSICPDLPPDPITVKDLGDCLRKAAAGSVPGFTYDELYAAMMGISIPGFPAPPLPVAMPEPYVDGLQNPETMIIEGIKNLFSAMVSSFLTMVTDFIDFILQIVGLTLPAVCVFIPIPDVTTTGLPNGVFPETPPPPKEVSFFRWPDFTAGPSQIVAGPEIDTAYTPLTDVGVAVADDERSVYFNRTSAGLSARVMSVDSVTDAITWGTTLNVDTGSGFTNSTPAVKVADNIVAVAWQDSPVGGTGTPGSVTLLSLGVTGTGLSKGTTVTFAQDTIEKSAAEPFSIIPLTADGTTERFAITYQLHGGIAVGSPITEPGVWVVVCSVSGTTVNVGPRLQLFQTHSLASDIAIFGDFVRQRLDYNRVTGIATGAILDRLTVAYDGKIRTVEINVSSDVITAETESTFGPGGSVQVKGVKGMLTRHVMIAYDNKVIVAADYVDGFEFGNIITLNGANSSETIGMVSLNRPAENMYVYQNGTKVVGRILSTTTSFPNLGGLTLVDETGQIDLATGTLGQIAPVQFNKKLLLSFANTSADLESIVYTPNRI